MKTTQFSEILQRNFDMIGYFLTHIMSFSYLTIPCKKLWYITILKFSFYMRNDKFFKNKIDFLRWSFHFFSMSVPGRCWRSEREHNDGNSSISIIKIGTVKRSVSYVIKCEKAITWLH
jgi:hypothetical protein